MGIAVACPCPICGNNEASPVRIGATEMYKIWCPQCGEFDFYLELPKAIVQGEWQRCRELLSRGLASGVITHRYFAGPTDVSKALGQLDLSSRP